MRAWTGLLALLLATSAGAATYLERSIEVELEGDRLTEKSSLLIAIEQKEDAKRFARHRIPLNTNIELQSCTAEVLNARGKVVRRVGRRRHERVDSAGFGVYNSSWVSVVPLGPLEVGQQLRLVFTRRFRQLYPAWSISLAGDLPQSKLEIRVRGDSDRFRWHIEGEAAPFSVRETPDGFHLEAHDVAGIVLPDYAPAPRSALPHLHVGWGRDASWEDVGRWYAELLEDLPEADTTVRTLATDLVEGVQSTRDRVRVLSDWVRRRVRYEAVEIGSGGYIPSPPGEVSTRAWGDCKDKAQLLLAMLGEVGIPSRMVLLRSGLNSMIARDFPSPYEFNHAILAVPADAAGAVPSDPVAAGFLFIDATWERGALEWLAPEDRGRDVLVVNDEGGLLVRIPDDSRADALTLEVAGRVTESGAVEGQAQLSLYGSHAVEWLTRLAETTRLRDEQDLQAVFGASLPGVRAEALEWSDTKCSAPCLEVRASIQLPALARGQGAQRLLRVGGLPLFPEPRFIEDRAYPLALRAGTRRTRWRLQLPAEGCAPLPFEERIENAVGRAVSRVEHDADTAVITRESALYSSWIELDQFEQLRELSVSEARANRRNIRLRCPTED